MTDTRNRPPTPTAYLLLRYTFSKIINQVLPDELVNNHLKVKIGQKLFFLHSRD